MSEIIKREIFQDIISWLDSREIIAIRGPRQCGKTTLLGQLEDSIEGNVEFVTFEDDFEKEKFEKGPKDYVASLINPSVRNYLLLDEVQYVRNAGKLLKLVYDTLDVKLIITGSSTLDLNEIGSYLVGRVILFEMYPFSFGEYLLAKDKRLHSYYMKNKVTLNKQDPKEIIFINELNKHLLQYLTFGGYPRIVLEESVEKKEVLIKNLVQTYIEKDIVKLYGITKRNKIIDLIRYLASVNGAMIRYNDICSALSMHANEIKDMLSILQQTYVIKTLRPFHKNMTTELKKNPKVYFLDTGLRNAMVERFVFGEDEKGILLENCLLKRFISHTLNYWRTTSKAEVDFIIDGEIPLESKTKFRLTRSFQSFISTYKPEKGFITNLDRYEKRIVGDTEVMIVPISLLL